MSVKPLWRKTLPAAVIVAAAGIAAAATIPALADSGSPEPAESPTAEAADPGKPHDDDASTDIVGGDFVTAEQPWVAALHRDGQFNCTASQIDAEWILTAAHCVTADDDFSVRIGSLQRSSGGEMRDVAEKFLHPDYDEAHEYDIALLRLAEPFENEYVSLATEEDMDALGQEGVIYGWGSENEDWSGPLPEDLKYAEGVTTDDRCDYESMICFTGNGTAAGGDSGGPIFLESPVTGEFLHAGVCAASYNPIVDSWTGYTSVPMSHDWIDEITGA